MRGGKSDASIQQRQEVTLFSKAFSLFDFASIHNLSRSMMSSSSPSSSSKRLSTRSNSDSEEVSDSELFAELEAQLDDETQLSGFDMGEYREKRMAQLEEELRNRPKKETNSFELGIDSSQMGKYIKLDSEKEAIALLERSGRKVVLHFSHAEFNRCKLMDQHLEHLAPMHPGTLFLAVSPLKAPFLVTKMDVKVLPYVVCFVNGKVEDRLVGFEELGNTDQFRRDELEDRLGKSGVLVPRSKQNASKPVFGFASGKEQDVDDWD